MNSITEAVIRATLAKHFVDAAGRHAVNEAADELIDLLTDYEEHVAAEQQSRDAAREAVVGADRRDRR